MLSPVWSAHQVLVGINSFSFEFFHDVAFPVFVEGPGENGYDAEAHFEIDGFFCLDALIVVLLTGQAEVLDVGSELGEVEVGVPYSWFVLGMGDQHAGFVVVFD